LLPPCLATFGRRGIGLWASGFGLRASIIDFALKHIFAFLQHFFAFLGVFSTRPCLSLQVCLAIPTPRCGFALGTPPSTSNKNGFMPDKNGFAPDKNGFGSNKNGFVPDKNGFGLNKNSFVPDKNGFGLNKNRFAAFKNAFKAATTLFSLKLPALPPFSFSATHSTSTPCSGLNPCAPKP
jgi:hypothetical protein